MSLNYASLLHTCFRHRLFCSTRARLDRRLDNDLITSARRADVRLLARPTHACTCYYKFPGNQGRGRPVWSWAAATKLLEKVQRRFTRMIPGLKGVSYKSKLKQESRAVAGNPRDAAVIFDIKNTINKDQWRTDVKLSYVNYLLNL